MPAIPASESHVIPASVEKVFDYLWITEFNVRSYGVDTDSALLIELVPYNQSTGEIDKTSPRTVYAKLWELVNEVPEAAAAMQSVFAAIPAIDAWHKQKAANLNQPVDTPVDEETPEP